MPLVTVEVSPSGEPIATTVSPTLTPEEVPSGAALSPEAPSTFSSARSLELSVPTTRAVRLVPSLVRTFTEEAPETTWLLVTISPSPLTITPEPVDEPFARVALTSTTLGVSAAAIFATSLFLPAATTGVAVSVAVVPCPVSCWKA